MSIYETLFDWQKKIVDKFKDKSSLGLFLDMGLGKTPIAMGLAEVNDCKKVIVITINSKATETVDVNGSWFDWASKSKIKYELLDKHAEVTKSSDPQMLLVNYEALFKRKKQSTRTAKAELKDNLIAFVNNCKNENVALIIDESHKTKNCSSVQTIAIMHLQRLLSAKGNLRTYLLTGTPFTTGYIDLYTQLKLLGHDGTKTEFIDTFCERGHVPGLLGWQQPIVGYKNVDKLYDLIHKFAITVKSEDVVDLPKKIFIEHSVPMSKDFSMFIQEKINGLKLEEYANERHLQNAEQLYIDKKINNPYYRNIAFPSLDWLAETTGSFWLRARQLSIGFQGNAEKFEWYDERRYKEIERFLTENNDNYLIFYNYTPELYKLYDICENIGYNIDVYCGEVKSLHFYNAYQQLSDADKLVNKKNVILANFASGSTGMNWQEYDKCIICSIPLYKDYEQGIKRIHRTGQKYDCIYHVFYQKNWLDESMMKALDGSIQYSNDMFESDLQRVQEIFSKSIKQIVNINI